MAADVELAPARPLDPVGERYWIPDMSLSTHAAWHAHERPGRAELPPAPRAPRLPVAGAGPRATSPDEIPPSAATRRPRRDQLTDRILDVRPSRPARLRHRVLSRTSTAPPNEPDRRDSPMLHRLRPALALTALGLLLLPAGASARSFERTFPRAAALCAAVDAGRPPASLAGATAQGEGRLYVAEVRARLRRDGVRKRHRRPRGADERDHRQRPRRMRRRPLRR